MYVMVGPKWLDGHKVQCRVTLEPASAVAEMGAGEEPGSPPSV